MGPRQTAKLIANPNAEIAYRGQRTPVRARLLAGPEREQRWQTPAAWYRYETMAERELCLFLLEPVTHGNIG